MKILYSFILALSLLVVTSSQIHAQTENNVRRDEKIVVAQGETVNDDYFATGEGVTISGTVNGDVFVAAGKVFIDGTINGDILVASGEVDISGPVSGNIRAMGGNITISSEVGGAVTIVGGNILITDRARIAKGVTGAFGSARILSPVGKSMHIAGGQVTLGNEVGHNVKAAVGKLALVNGAHIKGDLIYASDEEIDISGGAMVDGVTIKKILPEQTKPEVREKEAGNALLGILGLGTLMWIVNAFLLGALLLAFAPKYTQNLIETVSKKFWKSILTGLVAGIVIPVVGGILLITFFGIPTGAILFFAYILAMVFGKIVFSIFLGQKIQSTLKFGKNRYLGLLIGIIAFSILGIIPVIGWAAGMAGTLSGFGALLLVKRDLYTALRAKKLI